ncbi:restriction endonuclease subunit S [Comamonas terrigena]|uniref:restriction endonuclease subunit S n=1 Tax=Comamonas terrigena TaxID=32013 RepID=UPI0028AD4F8C|nr:restriction endonuclease subunit S [Comamonas terrigena]
MRSIPISEFCETSSGGTPSRDRADEFFGGGIPWVKSGELREYVITSTEETLTEAGVRSSSAKVVPTGSILIAMYGATVGRMATLGVDACTNQAVCAILPDPKVADSRYVFHALRSKVPHFLRQARGGAQPNISQGLIRATEIRLPSSLDEQRRVATILDKTDSLRRKRQEAIQLADEFLRAVFIDIFGRLDIASNPPVKLGDVVALDAPMVDPTNDEFADLLHVGPDRIEKGNGQLLECETARAEGLISKKFLFDERYVLYSKIRPVLKKCALAEFLGLCSADMYPVRPSGDEMTREFIWGLLLSDAFDRYVSTLPDRANIPKLNRSELNAFQFRLPSIKLQRKYSAIVQRTMALKRRHSTFLTKANSLPGSLGFFN